MKLKDKHIAILGAGRSGRAAAKLALREGAKVSVWDQAGPEAFSDLPEAVECHPNATEEVGADLFAHSLVVSPGIDTYGSYVKAFSRQVGEVIGEVELASRFYSGRIVGITGTNGKTTTTELVACMLAHAGKGGTACGNYGLPFSEVVLSDEKPEAVALELSSFQLETIADLRPNVAVWLNFAPDHMDRYPSVDDYRRAKLRIFKNVTAEDVIVVRSGQPIPDSPARMVTFSTEDADADWYSDGEEIRLNGEPVLHMTRDTGLRGLHNAENLMAALASCCALELPVAVLCQALRDYKPPLHRCELIRTLDGVEYLNDSKATNLHAMISALRSQIRPVVLICGGKDKGLDYREMLPLLSQNTLLVVTFGEIAGSLARTIGKAAPCEQVVTLDEAVAKARELAPRGSVVLLSPGTSSFDQFSGYEERGDHFRKLVQQLN
ncbi:MAG: UDP-N-acetylmuramoyl-L-alanine--D-glutamate ligase [Akkermansiaceae bacterium]|nr:UDP-N-acetylmuramoyl-L-alanine--D-glutamate ligase [Akkermansiaceae bacterium]